MYEQILTMPYPNNEIEADFPREPNRAAQFAPFAALSGYEEAVQEKARQTERRIELFEDEKEIIAKKIGFLEANAARKPKVLITYFIADKKKAGGKYHTNESVIQKIDFTAGKLVLADKTSIALEDILRLECGLWREYE